MHDRVTRFVDRARGVGVELEPRELDDSTHTAQEAATAVGAPVGAIVKSLLFLVDGEPLLVLASGANRVDAALLSTQLGGTVAMADAKAVKQHTGSSIGGVPPFAHPTPLRTVMDEDLLAFDPVWAAAASANAVFAIAPARLAEISGATVVRVC